MQAVKINNSIIGGCNTPVKYAASTTSPTGATSTSILDWVNTPAFSNSILATTADVRLNAPFNYATPDFAPAVVHLR